MSTQLTLDAWRSEWQEDPDDLLPLEEAAPTVPCTIVTGHDVVIDDLSLKIRAELYQFSIRNPQIRRIVVNSPLNRQFPTPSRRGSWEILAFDERGLKDAKDIALGSTHSPIVGAEAVLNTALHDWIVSDV